VKQLIAEKYGKEVGNKERNAQHRRLLHAPSPNKKNEVVVDQDKRDPTATAALRKTVAEARTLASRETASCIKQDDGRSSFQARR
jgi:hypothetical protein